MTQQLRNTNPPFPKNTRALPTKQMIETHTHTHNHKNKKEIMGLLAKTKSKTNNTNPSSSSSNDNRGMGLLLVFFPQDNNNNNNTATNFPSPPSKSLTPTNSNNTSNNNLILSKTQSTLSICALLLFITLLLFTLSTFEPSNTTLNSPSPRRFLLHKPPTLHINNKQPKTRYWIPRLWPKQAPTPSSHALQRMGILYRRGTRSMTQLLICHVADETTEHDFRLFLRLVHRSGLTSKTDVVFLFASPSSSKTFAPIVRQENDAFSSLVQLHSEIQNSTHPESNFDLTRFYRKPEMGEPLWGNKRIRTNLTNFSNVVEESEGNELNSKGGGELLLSYGSVLSFDATELDSENSLAGFLDRVPLSLRRWACYPMLLGRVRRNFKHVMLVDVKSVLVLDDPFGRVRNRSPESVFLFSKKNSEKTRSSQRRVNSAVVIGGARGVRRLCNTLLVEIVRAAMQQHKKNSVSDSVVLSQLVGNEFMKKSKGVHLIASTESIPEASSLVRRNSGTGATSLLNYAIIQRGTSSDNHDLSFIIKKEICSSLVDSSVYRDC